MLAPDLIESEAFKNLSGKWAVVVLIRFHQKAYRKNAKKGKKGMWNQVITNNGEIIFTYGEAKELGIKSSSTFCTVIRELVEDKGFISIAEPGNWYEQKSSKYSIVERWKKFGTPEYQKEIVPRSLPKGLGFQKAKPALIERSRLASMH